MLVGSGSGGGGAFVAVSPRLAAATAAPEYCMPRVHGRLSLMRFWRQLMEDKAPTLVGSEGLRVEPSHSFREGDA